MSRLTKRSKSGRIMACDMKYIIMCGGIYRTFQTPRQLTEIDGEPIVERTLRLLRECGIKDRDIAISSNDPAFERFGVRLLRHTNGFQVEANHQVTRGYWCDGFYPSADPVCYLLGDVVFSPEAIRAIVEYETDDIMFFGSKRPFADVYPKKHEEPFAFKVVNITHFQAACRAFRKLADSGKHWRVPIAWELWFIISGQDPAKDLRELTNDSYIGINDYTCDIDCPEDIKKIEEAMEAWRG